MASFPTTAILLSVLLSGLLAVSGDHGAAVSTEEAGFDYFMLALQWPATFCSTHSKKCCRENGCFPGASYPPGFTIQGLWPSNDDGTYPTCCYENAFDKNEISPLVGALTTFWPTLNCKMVSSCFGKKNSFWAHQWEKYGSCATPVLGGEFEYFLTTLNVYLKYNVTDALKVAGYVPSNKVNYTSSGIVSTIKKAFEATPILTCKDGAIEGVRLCLTTDFKIKDCVGVSDCPDNVSYPKFKFRDVSKTTEDWSIISGVKSS